MACEHLERGGLFEDATCGVTKRTIVSYTVNGVCDTWVKYTECADYKKAHSMCFITTAVCDSLGKYDDCDELMTMRRFRDEWLRTQSFGKSDIDDYYRTAPAICDAIDRDGKCDEIYRMLYDKFILPCVTLFKAGNSLDCYKMYKTMVNTMKEAYIQ
jgi:hypothetical protein